MEEKGDCKHCDELETVKHILLECENPKRKHIWKLAKETWEHSGKQEKTEWIQPNMETIMGIGNVEYRKKERKQEGLTRLYITIVTETIWLLWKDRNEWAINDKHITIKEATNKWRANIVKRCRQDYYSTSRKYERKALNIKTVRDTWEPEDPYAEYENNNFKWLLWRPQSGTG
jgi:hypothetical protein